MGAVWLLAASNSRPADEAAAVWPGSSCWQVMMLHVVALIGSNTLNWTCRVLPQAERRAAERAGEEEFRRRMLDRFAEEDRLEQMNMQVCGGGSSCAAGQAADAIFRFMQGQLLLRFSLILHRCILVCRSGARSRQHTCGRWSGCWPTAASCTTPCRCGRAASVLVCRPYCSADSALRQQAARA